MAEEDTPTPTPAARASGSASSPRVADLAARAPEVAECHRISGDDCFLLKVHVPAIEALEAVLDRFLLHGQTTSSFIVSTPVAPRTPAAGPQPGAG
jgi:Lrp/AsnC family leucine-responsive transcriptional regulator